MAVSVDVVILTVRTQTLQVLLVERGTPPYLGKLALPGGFVDADEDLDAAARRELTEETGLDADLLHIEQLATYGAPNRDPRGRVVTVSYLALMPDLPMPQAGGDARQAHWRPAAELLASDILAFDHKTILFDAVERARSKLEYTTLGAAFCPGEFTIADLRQVYETVWGHRLDPSNFHRKVTKAVGFLAETGMKTVHAGGRPAALYSRGPAKVLHPAILRPAPPSSKTQS